MKREWIHESMNEKLNNSYVTIIWRSTMTEWQSSDTVMNSQSCRGIWQVSLQLDDICGRLFAEYLIGNFEKHIPMKKIKGNVEILL